MELRDFFFQPLALFYTRSKEVAERFQKDPTKFADTFFANLAEIDPKIVRMIAYQLYINGINLGDLYKKRSTPAPPKFLSSLNTFPSETLLVILKYGFPTVISGNLFLRWSLSAGNNGEWLDFALDLALQMDIELNLVNEETGRTILHEAVENAYLPLIAQLLSHRLDPNIRSNEGKTALDIALSLFDFPDVFMNYQNYLEIVKQLVRYKAEPSQDLEREGPYQTEIERAIRAAEKIPADYCKGVELLNFLDQVEDYALIVETDPMILTSPGYQKRIRGTNMAALLESIEAKRKSVQKGLTWPHYIDTSIRRKRICPLPTDKRIKAASPPSPQEVYELAMRNMRDVKPSRKEIYIDKTPAGYESDEPWESFVPAPTPELEKPPTMPIPEGPMLPTKLF